MAILKFKSFEELDKFENEGKGVNWNFEPDEAYLLKALSFRIKVPFPPGVYKFKTFEEAQEWEREWWNKCGGEIEIDDDLLIFLGKKEYLEKNPEENKK